MSVISAVLKQLEEKYALLISRMERAFRLIQQHRDTYAKLYEDCEEVKSVLHDLRNSPSVGPVNLYSEERGHVCDVRPDNEPHDQAYPMVILHGVQSTTLYNV
ncbi:hypothetical protein TSAR_003342 [Trichomalopsis sarcophagae]|uniref:Uncharacterized protein n=1 Tax=Trichomalopsis sarcophagae TaxID=543379 RepID=A0A232EFD3_9HYME|nr:hypothetical protein TSAR_003342 [Trichomalopsis sarcophagae]